MRRWPALFVALRGQANGDWLAALCIWLPAYLRRNK